MNNHNHIKEEGNSSLVRNAETKAIINFERKRLKLLFETELREGINKFVDWHNNYH